MKKKKVIGIVLGAVAGCFVLVNAVWFGWRQQRYAPFTDGMQTQEESNFIVPRYWQQDDEGYDFSVKCPDYLTLTGNLCVSSPSEGFDPFTDALIIWPKATGGYEFGALLYDSDGENAKVQYQIMIDETGHALDSADSAVLERHQAQVEELLEKADGYWKIFND